MIAMGKQGAVRDRRACRPIQDGHDRRWCAAAGGLAVAGLGLRGRLHHAAAIENLLHGDGCAGTRTSASRSSPTRSGSSPPRPSSRCFAIPSGASRCSGSAARHWPMRSSRTALRAPARRRCWCAWCCRGCSRAASPSTPPRVWRTRSRCSARAAGGGLVGRASRRLPALGTRVPDRGTRRREPSRTASPCTRRCSRRWPWPRRDRSPGGARRRASRRCSPGSRSASSISASPCPTPRTPSCRRCALRRAGGERSRLRGAARHPRPGVRATARLGLDHRPPRGLAGMAGRGAHRTRLRGARRRLLHLHGAGDRGRGRLHAGASLRGPGLREPGALQPGADPRLAAHRRTAGRDRGGRGAARRAAARPACVDARRRARPHPGLRRARHGWMDALAPRAALPEHGAAPRAPSRARGWNGGGRSRARPGQRGDRPVDRDHRPLRALRSPARAPASRRLGRLPRRAPRPLDAGGATCMPGSPGTPAPCTPSSPPTTRACAR